jgi:hypothetical protein
MHKKSKSSVILGGLFFFKGLCLLFFTNAPGATFIQGTTTIPDSKVQSLNFWFTQ